MKIVPALPGIRRRILGAGSLLAAAVSIVSPAWAQTTTYYPKRTTSAQRDQLTNRATGFTRAQVAGEVRAGTGTVARHPRLIYTAAHVVWA